MKVYQGPVWIGNKPYHSKSRVTYDGGKTHNVEETEILYGAYFFLDTEGTEEVRQVANIMMVMSEIGGLVDGLLVVWIFLGTRTNETVMMKNLI